MTSLFIKHKHPTTVTYTVCNIHYMTHFPLTTSSNGVDALLVSTVTLSINVVSNKRLSLCEVGWMRVGGGGGGGGRREVKRDKGGEGGKKKEGEVRRGGGIGKEGKG